MDAQQFCAACGHQLAPRVDGIRSGAFNSPDAVAVTVTRRVGAAAPPSVAPGPMPVPAESMPLTPVAGPTQPAEEVPRPVAAERAAAGAAGIKQSPAAPPTFVPRTLATWVTGEDDRMAVEPEQPSSRSAAPTTATPQALLIAAGCSAGALVATALPWANRILVPSLAGLQFVFPLIPPVAALVVCWLIHSKMPKSLSAGWMWGLRISLALGLVAGVFVLAVFGQRTTSYGYSYGVSDVAQPAIGLWLYLIACGAGLVFTFRIPKADDLA